MRKFVDRLEGNKNMILGGMEHLDSWHEAQKGEESLIPPGMREPKPPSGEADEVRQHFKTRTPHLRPAFGLLTVAVGVAAAQVIEGAVDEIAAEKERMAKLGPHASHTP